MSGLGLCYTAAPLTMRRAGMHRLALVLLLLLAFALRLPSSAAALPGLYRDEAYYGLDAAAVLRGQWHLFFPANNGREPLFVYLVAAAVAILGRTPVAVRLPAAFAGTALVAAVYALGAMLFGRRVGLAAAGLTAVTTWPVLLSRVGLRAGLLPLVLALAAAATLRGLTTNDRRWQALGGLLAGLTLYTYTAARVAWLLPPIVVAPRLGHWWRQRRVPAPGWLAVVAVSSLPLLVVLARQPQGLLARPLQVALWHQAEPGPGASLALSARATLLMFHVRGDSIARHNAPGRPVYGPAAGLLSLLALGWSLGRWRRCRACRLLVGWLIVMLLPTLLAVDAPHFLRACGVLPVAMMLPAVGADRLARQFARRWARDQAEPPLRAPRGREGSPDSSGRDSILSGVVFALLAGLAIAGEFIDTVVYTARCQRPPLADRLAFAFETGAVELARQVNADLEAGWQGGWGVAPAGASGHGPQAVWLDRRLRDGWAAVPFLVADPDVAAGLPTPPGRSPVGRVTLFDPYDAVLTAGDGVAYLWPYDPDLDHIWAGLPADVAIAIRPGAWERGDQELEARRLFVRAEVRPAAKLPADGEPKVVARYASGPVLESIGLARGRCNDQVCLMLRTRWSVEGAIDTAPILVVRAIAEGAVMEWAREPLGHELYPIARWRPGDHFLQETMLPPVSAAAGTTLRLGLRLVGASGQPLEAREARSGRTVDELSLVLVVPPEDGSPGQAGIQGQRGSWWPSAARTVTRARGRLSRLSASAQRWVVRGS